MSISQNSRKRVALDVDDTIADVSKGILERINRMLGTSYTMSDLHASVGTDRSPGKESTILYHDLWVNNYRSIRSLVDSDLLAEVATHYDVELVSKRADPNGESRTSGALGEWLKLHGLDSYPTVIVRVGTDKSDLNYDIYVDDGPVGVRDNMTLYRICGPGEDATNVPNVVMCSDVNDALRMLLDAAAKD